MKCLMAWRIALMLCLLACGCCRQEDPAVREARDRIREFQDSLKVWMPSVRLRDNVAGTIGGWIACVSNASQRTELAIELSEMLLSVDLTNQPYRAVSPVFGRCKPRDDAITFFYRDYARAVGWIMKQNGCSPGSTMEFFLKALQKYKEACFSVPMGRRQLPGESREDCQARCDCARAGYSEYAQTMSEIRRFVLPRLSEYLPEELHDEFRRRIEPFFDFPSMDDFCEKMHLGSKCPFPAPRTGSNATTEAKTIPEAEVKVEFPESTIKGSNQ